MAHFRNIVWKMDVGCMFVVAKGSLLMMIMHLYIFRYTIPKCCNHFYSQTTTCNAIFHIFNAKCNIKIQISRKIKWRQNLNKTMEYICAYAAQSSKPMLTYRQWDTISVSINILVEFINSHLTNPDEFIFCVLFAIMIQGEMHQLTCMLHPADQ